MPYADRETQLAYLRDYHSRTPKTRAARKAAKDKQRASVRAYIQQAKDQPCADCGIKYPSYVMQFDHLGGKERLVGASCTLNQAKVEIAKCEVVCANCHAERTYSRL